ncbi:hypothetical protein PAP_02965 [Palaeococcus pacificus DY20341]|uniref:Permease n=1 Tax=Palaeococcus pacificus DY20341 TaxID=1343739 RepID=A0A075LWT7_9EURY|nr:AI-2E family transporter [Palaeococcus pacificus]AIF69013.1 hypothetical protein PAP_02965 [Palaeococcus pacificus DY20341]
MQGESIAWLVLSAIILFLVWKTIEPFVTPLIFGAAIAYIVLPVHHRLSKKIGEKSSAIALTAIMGIVSVLFVIGVVMWLRGTLQYIYIYVANALKFITRPDLPLGISETLNSLSTSIPERIKDSLLNYTLSIPLFILQVMVFLGIFYTTLSNTRFLTLELYRLIPQDNRELGEALIKRAEATLSALLRTWLLLSTIKGIFLAVGFIIFDITNVTGAMAAGILCIVLELLPVIGGWVMWVAGALYLILNNDAVLAGILFGLYGAIFISPIPDITIRPKLIAEGAKINAVIALIGIFGGLIAFGFKGLIIGPVSLGLLQTLVEEWKVREKEIIAG